MEIISNLFSQTCISFLKSFGNLFKIFSLYSQIYHIIKIPIKPSQYKVKLSSSKNPSLSSLKSIWPLIRHFENHRSAGSGAKVQISGYGMVLRNGPAFRFATEIGIPFKNGVPFQTISEYRSKMAFRFRRSLKMKTGLSEIARNSNHDRFHHKNP